MAAHLTADCLIEAPSTIAHLVSLIAARLSLFHLSAIRFIAVCSDAVRSNAVRSDEVRLVSVHSVADRLIVSACNSSAAYLSPSIINFYLIQLISIKASVPFD